ncbi:alpha/beta hydrolase [Kitasatospora sp. SUK 42]|uniref:alpha/beta hydrolase n=1 Tax=Kitasatospora sp. SUK 42 TaxID=1588882 RepID=UPI0018C8EF58|nr:alpha/beta hydrolase [Kitasatospora sp. SUK 42]MBV2156751.1 alpha/beta hydrolase family protein [Kitasatospora sp. SUK 42]
MDIKTLHDADLVNLTTAKTAFDTLATAFGRHVESWQHDVVDRLDRSQWTGAAAGHAQARIRRLHGELQAAHQEIGLVGRALHDAAEGFAAAQAHLVGALDDARAHRLDVAADGRITWDEDPGSPGFAGPDAKAQAQRISDRITAALDEADHADRTISARLAHLAGNAGNGTGLDAATARTDLAAADALDQAPATGTDPAGVKAWWNSLTDEQRHRMVLNHPDRIGALDGVPAVGRDQANRINLRRGRQDLQHRLDELGPAPRRFLGFARGEPVPNPEYERWKHRHDDLEDKLRGVEAVEQRLDTPVDATHPPAFLLGFDTDGRGHAIIAVNNPDTADNVSTYVPGTGARLGGIHRDINRSDLMVASADAANRRAGDPATTSSITWVGYDAPQSIIPEAADGSYARNAEDGLHRFETGLRATHEGTPSNNTVLAHSYGTTAVGYTMRDKGLPVDNVVLIASPGCGVEHAEELRIDPSHVYAAQSDGDAIGWATAIDPGGVADNIGDDLADMWGGGNGDHHLIHGRQTTVPDFGARILPADPGAGHSDYWNHGSPTLRSMGEVIAGKPVS